MSRALSKILKIRERVEGRGGLTLPLFPDTARIVPNSLARSALFSVRNHTRARAMYKRELIATVGGHRVTYTGEELRQDDLDIWMVLLYMLRDKALGASTRFTAYSVLRKAGWPTNGASYERLKVVLSRLQATSLMVEAPHLRSGWAAPLVSYFRWQAEDGTVDKHWEVSLRPEIRDLFGADQYAWIEWSQRARLTPLAKWLHAYFATHAAPYAMHPQTYMQACGSDMARVRDFKRRLEVALDQLENVGFLDSWHYDEAGRVIAHRKVPSE